MWEFKLLIFRNGIKIYLVSPQCKEQSDLSSICDISIFRFSVTLSAQICRGFALSTFTDCLTHTGISFLHLSDFLQLPFFFLSRWNSILQLIPAAQRPFEPSTTAPTAPLEYFKLFSPSSLSFCEEDSLRVFFFFRKHKEEENRMKLFSSTLQELPHFRSLCLSSESPEAVKSLIDFLSFSTLYFSSYFILFGDVACFCSRQCLILHSRVLGSVQSSRESHHRASKVEWRGQKSFFFLENSESREASTWCY